MRKIESSAEMPFLEHLEELRWRIIWALTAAAIGIAIGFYLVIRALYPRERTLLIAALLGGVGLFAVGAWFAYAVVIPLSLPWLFTFFGTTIDPMITAQNYFGFVFGMVLTFGIAFELPVVVLLLSAAGLVTPSFLRRYRRHAFLLILVAGALLTPGSDITTTLALAGPLCLLYELSVLVAGAIWRRRKHDDAIAILLAPLLLLRRRAWASARPA